MRSVNRRKKRVNMTVEARDTQRVSIVLPLVLGVLSLLFTLLVKLVDVAPKGPSGTRIGFSRLNVFVHELLGEHLIFYTLSQALGLLAMLIAFVFAMLGLTQLVRRKHLLRVDARILALGVEYILVALLFVFFEIVIINYRPVIMPGESVPEASFPSTHTMLACVVFMTAPKAAAFLLRKNRLRSDPVKNVCIALASLTVLFRFLSGVHWLTDIIGGILYSATLVLLYDSILYFVSRKKNIASNVRFR